MSDGILHDITGSNAPASGAFDIVPNDSADLPEPARSLLVGGTGDVAVTMIDGSVVTLPGVSGFVPVRVKRVWATGTGGGLTILGLR